jgi:RNA polymerase sigma factor (sigma-70 family)
MSSSALSAGLRQLRHQLAAPQRREDSDEQLLHAFTSRRDDNAFAALVHRHGPMVLKVCRRLLGQEQDAEDVFQATFLVLARNASSLRNKGSLASFLHGIAYRLARDAKRSAERRRKYEGQWPSRSPVDPADELSWREVQALLDEEIARLPEIYRSVFILCCLEDLSRAEAAQRLGLKECTLLSRLTKARKRLSQRLAQRGVELAAVVAAATLPTQPASALPVGLAAKTIQAVLASSGSELAGMVSTSVVELLHRTTTAMVSKTKIVMAMTLAVGLLGGAGVCFLASPQRQQEQAMPAPRTGDKAAQASRSEKPESAEAIEIQGRVLNPDGKPAPRARLYVPLLKGEQLRSLATSDAAGQFRFQVKPAEVHLYKHLREPWRYVDVVAVAEGYGPGMATVGDPAQADKLTIRLARDDVPIQGRVLDLQGKPLAGVSVRVGGIGVPKKGDLTAFLENLKIRSDGYPAEGEFLTGVHHADFVRLFPSVTTGADGRFQLRGIGGERIAYLTLSGPTIETKEVRVRTRPGERIQKLQFAFNPGSGHLTYYGQEFEHLAAPTKPIVGVVRDKNTGKPLANVTIVSDKLAGCNVHGNRSIRTVTDKEGRYRMVGMPKGEGDVIVALPSAGSPYLAHTRSVEDTFGLDPTTVDFELRRGVLVKGRVTDKKTGAGVEGAQLGYFVFQDNQARPEFRDWYNNPYLATEADGSFQMTVPPGHAVIGARAVSDHYLVGLGAEKIKRWNQGDLEFLATEPFCDPTGYHRLLEINPAKDVQTLTCNLEVDPGYTLHGTIIGPDGKPLAGARICGLRSYIYTVWEAEPLRTAEFTAHALSPERPRNLLVIHEGKHLAGSLVVRGDGKGPVTIKLQPWGTLAGRLVAANGKPYAKGELRFAFVGRAENVTAGAHPLGSIPRDKAGRFRVEGLIPGLKYNLALFGVGNVGKEVIVAAGETKDLGDVTVRESE